MPEVKITRTDVELSAVKVDSVTLNVGGDYAKVTDKQLERLEAMPGVNLKIKGGSKTAAGDR